VKVAAIVESRLASTRLPGKGLRPLHGRPLLARLLERLRRCETVHEICVATSTDDTDAPIEELARREGAACHRGPLEDVLGRVLGAATALEADVVVEITGDCPLVDPRIVDAAVRRLLRGDVDYVANVLDRLSFPVGLDVQVYPTARLAEVAQLTDDPYDRNNVTPFFYRNPQRYRLLNLFAPPELDRPGYRLCVDYPQDFALVESVYRELHAADPAFGAHAIIALLDARPELARSNTAVPDAFSFPSSGGRALQEPLQLPCAR
jgi:spore coat polysaccharide biosynthesis protein SpsF